MTNLVTAIYDARDIAVNVGGSYGAIISDEQRDPDGLVAARQYADNAGTMATFMYDPRRNLMQATVERNPAPQWSVATATYIPPVVADLTTPLTLQDSTFHYDPVNNPRTITDARPAAEWPANQGPVASTAITYDDRYRVTGIGYGYPNGASPFQVPNFLPTDPPPINFQTPTFRSTSQSYVYDWQGNVTTSDDSEHALLQRSAGHAAYGPHGPNQVTSGSLGSGSYTATYDDAGNLKSITGSLPLSADENTLLTLAYDWDEAGALRTAQRTDATWMDGRTICVEGGECFSLPPRELGSTTIADAYLYDGGGQRTWHSSDNTGIEETGQFINRGSAEGKYFSLDPEGVSSYAKQAVAGFGDPPYTMVQTQIRTRLLTPEMGARVDRGVNALVLPNGLLPGLTPTVSPFMVVP